MTPQQEERFFQIYCHMCGNATSPEELTDKLFTAAASFFTFEKFKEVVFNEISKRAEKTSEDEKYKN